MSDGSSGNGVPAAATGYARLKSTMVGSTGYSSRQAHSLLSVLVVVLLLLVLVELLVLVDVELEVDGAVKTEMHVRILAFHLHPATLLHGPFLVSSEQRSVLGGVGGGGVETEMHVRILAFHLHPATLLHGPFLVSSEQTLALGGELEHHRFWRGGR
eukprot:gene8967-biopygen25964